MVKEAARTPIPQDTEVRGDNWKELQQLGLVHCTNIICSNPLGTCGIGSFVEDLRTRDILRWEVGETNVFEGWPLLEGSPQAKPPHEFFGPTDDTGFYVIPPDEDWTGPWSRKIDDDHPEIVSAGISSLLVPDMADFDSFMTWNPPLGDLGCLRL